MSVPWLRGRGRVVRMVVSGGGAVRTQHRPRSFVQGAQWEAAQWEAAQWEAAQWEASRQRNARRDSRSKITWSRTMITPTNSTTHAANPANWLASYQ
jgi:hypothetical protein